MFILDLIICQGLIRHIAKIVIILIIVHKKTSCFLRTGCLEKIIFLSNHYFFKSLRPAPTLNFTTLLAGTLISFPVFGLRAV